MERTPTTRSQSALRTSAFGFLWVFGLLGISSFLSAASPDLRSSTPRGGQRGTEVKVTLTGNRLSDMEKVVFHKPGITAKDVKAIDSKKVEATFVIAPDCELGEHQMRLLGKSGFSYARTFWVGQFKEVKEVEPNDEFEKPQVISINTTVNGSAKPEEVDYYRVQVKKGQRISVEMEALRINNLTNAVAMDPYVAILNKDRFELAVSDDSALLKQESVASVVAPEDGDYTIEIRDAAYQGRGAYRAHISTSPRPLGVYPAGGKAGSEVEFTFLGDPSGPYKSKLKLPGATDSHYVFGPNGGQIPVSGNRVRVSDFENVLEQEPNDSYKNEFPEPKALPLAFNGILEKEGDYDYFKFTAKKGQRFRFRSYANRLGTPVDTVMHIFDSKIKSLAGNDDADGSKDSRVDFTAPADGEYFVRVYDMLKRGGEHFVYRIESEPFSPRIGVTMPEMLRRDNQYRKQFNIPRGNYYAMNVNMRRENMSGDLVFDLPNLPAGVTWEAGTIPKSLSQFPILFKAAPDAPIGGGMYDLFVKSADPKAPVSGKYEQTFHFVRGNPNGTSYYAGTNDQLPIAVTEKAPFRISIDQPKVPIVRNGTMKLKVRAHRDEGYQKKITARMLWRPPGISCPSTMTFSEKATEIEYELNANSSAALAEWKLCLLAESDAGKGLIFTASPFINLKVEEPFVKMKINMTSVKQGDPGEIHCTVENLREFDGQGDVQMFSLPPKTTSKVLKVDKNTTELLFPVTTANDTPVGQHKNLFCTVTLMKNGEPIQHRIGMGGVIRVDRKPKEVAKVADGRPDPKKETPAPKPVAKTAPKPSKPLSRLEQLRLEAKKQAAQSN
jgi:hypothetical protein